MQSIEAIAQRHRLLLVLLPSVEAAGMLLSPDRYIRLQRLWQVLPNDCPSQQMRDFLCPIFATDELQQDAFHDVFERIVNSELAMPVEAQKQDEQPQESKEEAKNPEITPKQDNRPDITAKTPTIDTLKSETKRNSLVVDLEQCTEPPYSWNIAPKDNLPEIAIGEGFNRTMLQLRRRELADHSAIDIGATIKATINGGGLPAFRYKRQSRPPEYLLLVERFSRNDHRAGLFDYVFQALRANEVFVERFFYDNDPRINRNEQYPAGLNLYELRNRYPDARLVLLGSGYRLLSPRTGKLAEWASPLHLWRVRALLTPISHTEWGYQERQLDASFLLLPASVESLQYIAESPDAADVQYELLPDYIREIAETEPLQLQEPIMRSLRQHFDSDMLCWIASCAVYPALHFELTQQLGKILTDSFGYNLLTSQNLLGLARLTWFTNGRIPVPVRKDLMKYLRQRHPEKQVLVVKYLRELMEQNKPTNENSVAYAEHRVNLAVMKAMTGEKPDAETVAELRAVVKRLDRDAGWGDFVLPEAWEEIFKDDRLEATSVPAEIEAQGTQAMQRYLEELAKQGTQKIFEAQMIVIGEPMAGKTTLIRKLFDKHAEMPEIELITRGIEQQVYSFLGDNGGQYRVNITDFGGQEIYHSTNLMFYKERALYLLVMDSDINNPNLVYWLESVKGLGNSSSVILVINAKNDRKHGNSFIELQSRFPFLKEEHHVNILTGRGLDQLIHSIQSNIQKLPHLGYQIPKNWADIRKKLEELEKPFITWEHYLNVCREYGIVNEESARLLADYLHSLGFVLYFSNNHILRRIVILKPKWATDAVYSILDDRNIQNNNGRFDLKNIGYVFSGQVWADMLPELIELLKLFEICFTLEDNESFIIPQLLPNYPPKRYTWDSGDNLQFELHYSYKPSGLLSRFIARRHADIQNNIVWRKGVVLEWSQTMAQVTESNDEAKIKIRIRGKDSKGFLRSIQNTFDGLHAELNNLEVRKYVPCKCSECTNSRKPQLFDYEGLLKRIEHNRKDIECPKSFQYIPINALLDDSDSKSIGAAGAVAGLDLSKGTEKPLRAFIAYSKHDIEYINEFRKHIQPLVRLNELSFFDDRQILPGKEWDRRTKKELESADIIFLMVSVDFLNTNYIWNIEIEAAMRRHESGEVIVIPIKLRQCDWTGMPFSKLQGLPRKDNIGTRVINDAAWVEVMQEVRNLLKEKRVSDKWIVETNKIDLKQKKKVFLCYSKEDQPLMDDFCDRFKNYNEADMEILYDRNANSRNMHEVFSEFANQCDVAILLVNARFVNPESYANKYEIPVLLDRQKNGEVVVVGVRFSNVSDLEEWNAEGDVYFFSLTNNDLHYTRDKSPKNEAFLRKFAIYDKVDDRDRDEYHDRLRHWIKSAIFFNKEKNLQIEGKVEGSQLILTSFSNNFNVELKNSTILLTYLISFALEDSMKNKEAKIENIELWVTQNVYQITSKSLKDVYFAELLSQIDAFQNNIKSEIDKEIRLIGYKVNYFKLSGSALEVKNSFSFDFNEFEQEFDTNLGDTVRLNIVVNGRIIDYYHENLKHTLTPETDLAKQIKKEIRSEVRKFILLCKPEQYYLEFNSVLLPELEKILRGNLIEQYNVAQDIGIVVKFLGSKLITRLQNLMKGFITSTVQYQNGKLKLKIKFNVEGVRKNRWDRFANRNYKSAKEEQENLSDELRVLVENTMRKEFGKIPLVAISTMADIVKQFAILSIEPIGENTGLTIRITSVEVLNMSSSTLVDNSLKKEQDIFNQKKHNTNNSETVNILKRFTSRLNAYASIYGSTIPTEIPPSVIIEIQTLCHEISTYINTNHPNIEQDNLEAFYSIYDRTNGLVSLVQRKEGTTQFYFRELRHLLSDLRNISL